MCSIGKSLEKERMFFVVVNATEFGVEKRKDPLKKKRKNMRGTPIIRNPNCKCNVCGKEMYRRPSQIQSGNVFCSKTCTGLFSQKERTSCKICQTEIKQSENRRRKRIYCSRSCSNKGRKGSTYKLETNVSRDRHKITYNLKMMLVKERGPKCEKCPCDIVQILHCHHIIEVSNGGDDSPNNLMLLCPNCHATEHQGFMTWEEFLKESS